MLIGRGGDDRLNAGLGTPLRSSDLDGDADRLACGAGDDVVDAAGLQPIPRTCERLTSPDAALNWDSVRVQLAALPGGRIGVEVVCSLEVASCRRRVTLRAASGLLGRSRLARVPPG